MSKFARFSTAVLVAVLSTLCVTAQESAESETTGLAGLVGTWELAGESRYGELLHTLVVDPDGTATYESSGEVADVMDLHVEGNEVRFKMTVFGGPGSYELAFAGSYDVDALTGDILSNGGSFSAVTAPRAADSSSPPPDVSGLVGTWKLTGMSPYGPLEHELVVQSDGTATYTSNGEVSEVTHLEIDGDKVRFDMTVWGGPGSHEVSFEGSFDDDRLVGEILANGASFAPMTAPRQSALD